MKVCYILYSEVLDSYYIGITTENISDRIDKHNTAHYGSKYTSKASDWKLFFTLECECQSQLVSIEKHIKKMKSKTYIKNLIRYPEITQKLKEKYSCS